MARFNPKTGDFDDLPSEEESRARKTRNGNNSWGGGSWSGDDDDSSGDLLDDLLNDDDSSSRGNFDNTDKIGDFLDGLHCGCILLIIVFFILVFLLG